MPIISLSCACSSRVSWAQIILFPFLSEVEDAIFLSARPSSFPSDLHYYPINRLDLISSLPTAGTNRVPVPLSLSSSPPEENAFPQCLSLSFPPPTAPSRRVFLHSGGFSFSSFPLKPFNLTPFPSFLGRRRRRRRWRSGR